MTEDIMINIVATIQNQLEEEIDKMQDNLIEEFVDKLRIKKQEIVSDVMKNLIISFNRDTENTLNYTIIFKIINKEQNEKEENISI